MGQILFANNAETTISGGITNVATSVTVQPGAGALFPNPTGGDYFKATFVDTATGLINEIVNVTARSGDTMTIVRGQEGTTALAWLNGDKFANFDTADTMANLVQPDELQIQPGNIGLDTGTADALAVVLDPVPASLSAISGAPLRVLKAGSANTGAATISINALGPIPIVHADGSPLGPAELPASAWFSGIVTASAFILQSVSTAPGVGNMPTGAITAYAGLTLPSGYLECDGSLLSTATYSSLFAIIGYTFGGSGANFGVPDLRGQFIRGWSHGSTVDNGRGFGTGQQDAFQGHRHGPPPGFNTYRGQKISGNPYDTNGGGSNNFSNQTGDPITDGTNGSPRIAGETRPVNVALMYIIKT